MADHPHDPNHLEKPGKPNVEHHHHYVLPDSLIYKVGAALAVLTVITVAVSYVDLGRLNFLVAFLIATFKGLLVALFFMNLRKDARENGVMFGTSFLFLAIFIVLTSTDLFFRGDVYVKGSLVQSAQAESKSKYKDPWTSRPELVAKGKELFAVQCVSCHGVEGKGDGPAATALNPPPRNFHVTQGWKNPRKITGVFKTLKEGIAGGGMASFATLPADDRWALAHFVLSLGAAPEKPVPGDFASIGIDPTKEGGGETVAKTVSVAFAMEQMAQPESGKSGMYHEGARGSANPSNGERLYMAKCASCHGDKGEGGIRVKSLGVNPQAFVTTRALSGSMDTVSLENSFNQVVIHGMPGDLMPGNPQLSGGELHDLHQYVRGLGR